MEWSRCGPHDIVIVERREDLVGVPAECRHVIEVAGAPDLAAVDQ